jgi:hypothetical protein
MYPFRVLEAQKLDTTRRRDRPEDADADLGAADYRKRLHIHKLRKGQELFCLEHDGGDTYFMHYLNQGQDYKDFHDQLHKAHPDIGLDGIQLCRTDSVREQATFLVDCHPLHCPYERDFLRRHWADWRIIFSRDCLNLPIDRIEGYYGSEAGFYYAWIQVCQYHHLYHPASLPSLSP